jgi:hypothetical protein
VTSTWTQRAGFYVEHLSELGYRPKIDEEDDIYFAYLNFWPVEGEDDLRRALLAASVASRNTKVAKVSVRPDLGNMHITAEVFLARPTDLVDVFERLVGAIQQARTVFLQEVERRA